MLSKTGLKKTIFIKTLVPQVVKVSMDYLKEYKSFINSYYWSEGIRMTAGIALPAIVLSYFNFLSVGLVVSLGAMCASITDNPGPIHHRRNGMLVCIIITFFVSLLTGFAAPHPILLGTLICIFCFIFSFVAIYGTRANSVGLAALVVMVLNIDRQHYGWDVLLNASYILAGGAWYMLLSLLSYGFRPFKLAQQALGECIEATADYLRIRASLYNKQVDYEKTFSEMLQQQVHVHEKQNLVRELLFKTRAIVKESTNTGRTLVMIFIDIVDLFERAMTTHQDYEALHHYFDDSGILQQYRQLILDLVKELDDVGIAIKSGKPSYESGSLQQHIKNIEEYYARFRDKNRTTENFDAFISLRHILNGIEDIASRIHTLHRYTKYHKKLPKEFLADLDYEKFITHQDMDPKLLKDNLTLQSNIFRHALRLSTATLTGFIISKFLPVGHSYWILLTIIVILKPNYSLTKKRNYQRLLGTIAGALIGLAILFFIKDPTALFVLMLLLMIGTYSSLRLNYLVSVLFMTPYILLLFHLLNTGKFETILTDRIADTVAGSLIAFVANLLIIPAWERGQIKNYMTEALEGNLQYFITISSAFMGKPADMSTYKLSRKNAFVSLANLSDIFNRMLQEPKTKQINSKLMHQFVVLNHMLTSHIATLSYYTKSISEKYASKDFAPVIKRTELLLKDSLAIVNADEHGASSIDSVESHLLEKRVNELMNTRRAELEKGIIDTDTRRTLSEFKSIVDQFNFIYRLAADVKKISLGLQEE